MTFLDHVDLLWTNLTWFVQEDDLKRKPREARGMTEFLKAEERDY